MNKTHVNEYRSSGMSPPGTSQTISGTAEISASNGLGSKPRLTGKSKGRLLTLPETAEYLNCSLVTVRRLIWDGRLPSVKWDRRLRLDIRDLEQFVENHKN